MFSTMESDFFDPLAKTDSLTKTDHPRLILADKSVPLANFSPSPYEIYIGNKL